MRQIHLIAVAVFTATGLYLAYLQYRKMDQKIRRLEKALGDTNFRDNSSQRRCTAAVDNFPGAEKMEDTDAFGKSCDGGACPISLEPAQGSGSPAPPPVQSRNEEGDLPSDKESRPISHLETQYSNFQMLESDNEADVESDAESVSDSSGEESEETEEEREEVNMTAGSEPGHHEQEASPAPFEADEHGLPELNSQDIEEMDEFLASPKEASPVMEEMHDDPTNLPEADLPNNKITKHALEETENDNPTALKKMTVSQLRAEIRNRGGDLRSRMKKTELVALYATLL